MWRSSAQGNVAIDVARILAKTPAELADTDIADHALEMLRDSKVKNIYVIGRRGPAQAAFTNPEIKELGELADAELVVDPAELELDPLSQVVLASDKTATRNLETLRKHAHPPTGDKARRIYVRFLLSPAELIGEDGRVVAIKLQHNRLEDDGRGGVKAVGTGEYETLPAGLVFRSIGYKGVALPGVPHDERNGTIPNDRGRVLDPATGQPLAGEYVVGWAKRGPSGIIGTNKPDSVETVKMLLEDAPQLVAVAGARWSFLRLLNKSKASFPAQGYCGDFCYRLSVYRAVVAATNEHCALHRTAANKPDGDRVRPRHENSA